MISYQDFFFLVIDTILSIDETLDNQRSGNLDSGNLSHLENIRKELVELKEKLKSRELPPVENRWLSAAHYVLDSWPREEPLGERICMLDYLYRHLAPGVEKIDGDRGASPQEPDIEGGGENHPKRSSSRKINSIQGF